MGLAEKEASWEGIDNVPFELPVKALGKNSATKEPQPFRGKHNEEIVLVKKPHPLKKKYLLFVLNGGRQIPFKSLKGGESMLFFPAV